MSRQSTVFLRTPSEIRKGIYRFQNGEALDFAVAFVGADWNDLLADFRGKLRLICWLSSTNTNPNAVENLMKRPRTVVKQRHSMHCKIYLCSGIGAVVGSANLSKAALAEGDNAGQNEAAVLVVTPSIVEEIGRWFDALWNDKDTRTIKSADLAAAKSAWEKARAQREKSGSGTKTRSGTNPIVPFLPKRFHPQIVQYANRVRSLNLRDDLGTPQRTIGSINPNTLTRAEQQSLIDCIVSWTRHPGVYKTFRNQPLSQVRKGLYLLFDNSVDLKSRLDEIQYKNYLHGLRMASLSLLLYWRSPENFPPYNHRTIRFLSDFKFQERGMSAASPECYVTWLRWATRFSQGLHLPTVGHVDRMVERYYEDVKG
jgi:hypothetical protein